MSDTLCLVDLTTKERDYVTAVLADDLDEIPLRDEYRCALINGIMRKLDDALEVTEPWHMMGTRDDGAAVGRGRGPIGGCGQSVLCTPEPTTLPKGPLGPVLGDDPFGREGVPMGKITAYGVLDMKTGTATWYGDGEPPDWFTNRANDAFREARMVPYPKHADDDTGDPVDGSA
jgi:hypothetical protein